MSSSSNKQGRYFTLRPETIQCLKNYSTKTGTPMGDVIDELVLTYLGAGQDQNTVLAQAIVAEFDKHHASEISKIQSSLKFTDINVQTIIQALNTIFWWLPNGPKSGTFNGSHQVLRDAKNRVDQKIANNKQKADSQKIG